MRYAEDEGRHPENDVLVIDDDYMENRAVCIEEKLEYKFDGELARILFPTKSKDEPASLNDKARALCQSFRDVRSFGYVLALKGKEEGSKGLSVGVRGPVTITTAKSVQTIQPITVGITKCILNSEKDRNKRGSDTMGKKYRVDGAAYYDAVCREPIEESDNWLEFWRDERDSLGYFDTAGEVDTFRNLSDGDEYVYYLPGTISESAGLGWADITQKSLQEAINEALSTLTPREEKVLRLRFGLDDRRIRTLEEVGEELNTTRERIRHIEAKALRKLRHPFCSAQLRDFL